MTVIVSGGTIALKGICSLEDAETLLSALVENLGAAVDWSGCEQAHAAVVQVLLAAGVHPLGAPADAILEMAISQAVGRPADGQSFKLGPHEAGA